MSTPVSAGLAGHLPKLQFPVLKDRLIGVISGVSDSPTAYGNNGEGSSFLSVPTKRNCNQRDGSVIVPDEVGYLDFKKYLLKSILKATAPDFSSSQSSAIPTNGGLASSLVPTDQQWYGLNQLRIHAGAPERTEKGIERLMQYYAQLCWLEERFPFETDQVLETKHTHHHLLIIRLD